MVTSKQARISDSSRIAFYNSMRKWIEIANINPPTYGNNSRLRDEWLRAFSLREPHLAGVINSVVSIDKNRGWQLIGGRNQVMAYSQILKNVEPTSFDKRGLPINGKGWRYYFSQQSFSFWTSDLGAVSEIGRDTKNGPLRALWSVDPVRCELYNNDSIKYHPPNGKVQEWGPADFMRETSLPSNDETLNGLGYCATSRLIEIITIMIAVYGHDKEKLLAKIPKGMLFLRGIDEVMWADAMEKQAAQQTAKEREYYAGLSIFFSDSDEALDAKLLSLSQLPDGFDIKIMTDLLMFAIALNFGYDPSEFWPVQFGSLGRGTEAEVQAVKASGKGGLDFVLAFQDNLQREIPSTLHFEFEQRNEQGEILEANVAKAWAETINEMAKPSGTNEPPTLSISEKRQLLAQKGLIPEDWTIEEEDTVATDTEDVDRYLDNDNVRRAIAEFPHDDIVMLKFDPSTSETREKILLSHNERRRFWPAKTRAVLYDGRDVLITDDDVDLAIQQARERVGDRYGDILEADVVNE